MEGKTCPECLSEINSAAVVCKFCGNRIVGIECGNCASICKPKAKVCKWCGETLVKKKPPIKLEKDVELKANFLGTLFSRRSLFPQRIIVTKEKIVIRTYDILKMKKKDKTIVWNNVNKVDHKKGYFWDKIMISEQGQSAATIDCLRRSDAVLIKKAL